MMSDFKNIFSQVKNLQENSKEIQEKMKHIEATVEVGAGMVKATVNGEFQVTHLEIDSSSLSKEELPVIKKLIMNAINSAQKKVKDEVQKEMISLTNLPSNLTQFFNK